MGYEHLCLPMEYEGPRKITSIGFVDPRKEQGELLFPERFPRDVVERDKKIMGPYAVAGQFQQRPSPAEGGEFLPDMIQVVDVMPAGFIRWARGWDLAATEGAGDYTASAKIGILQDGSSSPTLTASSMGRPSATSSSATPRRPTAPVESSSHCRRTRARPARAKRSP